MRYDELDSLLTIKEGQFDYDLNKLDTEEHEAKERFNFDSN